MREWMRSVRIIGAAGTLAAVMLVCSTLDASHAAAACGSANMAGGAKITWLKSQIASNRVFQARHECATQSSFACREIAKRIAGAEARISAIAATQPVVCEAKAAAPGKKTVKATRRVEKGIVAASKMETRCVRPSDGYYFPTPNSGFSTSGNIDAIAAQCRMICDDPTMEVYKLNGANGEADDMISLTTGTRYAELPHAGAYRKSADLKTCDVNRYYKMVLAKTPEQQAQVVAEQAGNTPATRVALFENVSLRGATGFPVASVRKVRIVGAAFLPEE